MALKILPGLLVAMMFFSSALVGCEREGPMERAGSEVDEMADEVREGDNPLQKDGPMEEAGESIDEAVEGN